MSIYNSAEYHFAQADTDRDVDKQNKTEIDNQGRRGERRNEFIMTDGPG